MRSAALPLTTPPEVEAVLRLQAADRESTIVPAAKSVPGKRAFDVCVGALLAIVTLPMQAVALVASAIAFRANPIFSQERVGKDGKTFMIRKVRSLPTDTASSASKYDIDFEQNTLVGQFLRKTHLDETIQFWAVIGGRLSLVGPRPEMVSLAADYDPTFLAVRTSVTPGITGLWQISDASDGLIAENPQYDLAYTAHRSWSLEIWIMFRTALKMALGRTVSIEELKKVETIGLAHRIRSKLAA